MPTGRWLLPPLLVALAACGDDRPPGASLDSTPSGGSNGSTTSSSSGSASSSSSTSSSGAPSDPDAAAPLCAATPLGEDPGIGERRIPGDPVAPAGGELVEGTYRLTQREHFDPTAGSISLSADRRRGVLLLTATTLQLRSALEDGSSETLEGWSFVASGAKLTLTPVCPTASGPTKTVDYTVEGSSLILFRGGGHLETYTRE